MTHKRLRCILLFVGVVVVTASGFVESDVAIYKAGVRGTVEGPHLAEGVPSRRAQQDGQNFLAPLTIVCPNNVSLSCTADPFNLDLTGNPTKYGGIGTHVVTHEDFRAEVCSETIKRTFQLKDDNNAVECAQIITVEKDTTPPTITCPPDVTDLAHISPTDPSHPKIGQATASDACLNFGIVFKHTDTVTTCGTISRTWTVRDDCQNEASCVQNISYAVCKEDVKEGDTAKATSEGKTPEVTGGGAAGAQQSLLYLSIECPDDVSVPCGTDPAKLVHDEPTVAGGKRFNITSQISQKSSCLFERTLTATDIGGEEANCTHNIIVYPEIDCPYHKKMKSKDLDNEDKIEKPYVRWCGGGTLQSEDSVANPCESGEKEVDIKRTWIAENECSSAQCYQPITVKCKKRRRKLQGSRKRSGRVKQVKRRN